MEWSAWLIVTVILLFVVYEVVRKVRSYQANLQLARSMGMPYEAQFISQNALAFKFLPRFISRLFIVPGLLHSLEFVKLFEKHDSGILALVSSSGIQVYINDPALIKDVCLKNKNSLHKPTHLYGVLNLFGENIVTAPDGSNWRKHRQAATPAFGDENCALVARSTIKQLGNMFQKWEEQGGDVVWQEDSTKLTLSVISEAGFGQRFNMFSDDTQTIAPEYQAMGIQMSFKEVMEIISNHLLLRITLPRLAYTLFPTKRLQRIDQGFKDFEKYAEHFIQEGKAQGEEGRKDLLGLLIQNSHLSQQDILSNTFIFLVAGHETTANTLSFSMGLLALHPDIQEQVYEESVAVLGHLDPDTDDYYSCVNKLPLAKAVFEETLRLYPSATNIPKWTVEETEIGGYSIPPRVGVSLAVFAMHRSSKVWKNPNAFDPTRFLGSIPENGHVPFSLGQRSCIGKRFAIIEAVLIIALTCLRYRIHPKKCDLDHLKSIITLQPITPVQLRVERRED